MEGAAKRGDLAGASHLHAQERVRACQARPGELRHLDGHVVVALRHQIARRRHLLAEDGAGGHLDEVDAEHLAHKGEGAARTQVALDHLEVHGAVRVHLADDLHVVRPADLERPSELLGDLLEPREILLAQREGRQHQRRVARVHAGVFHVLRDGVEEHLALVRDGVNVDLLRIRDELGEHHGVLGVHLGGHGEVVLERGLVPDHIHRRAGEHVAGTHQHRVGDAAGKLLGLLHVGDLHPVRLVHADGVEDLGELVAVLGRVDAHRVGAEHIHVGLLEPHRNVLRQLPTDRDDGARGLLQLVDVHHTLEAELLKVEPVRLVVVRADRLWVVVDHDRVVAGGLDAAHTRHRAPVELDRGADPVDARAEHHGAVLVELHVVARGVVRGVQVVGLRRVFGRHRVDPLHKRCHSLCLALGAHLGLAAADQLRDLQVREPAALGGAHQVHVHRGERAAVPQLAVRAHNVLQLVEEPAVDLGELVEPLHVVVALQHRVGDGKEPRVGRDAQCVVQVRGLRVAVESAVVGRHLAHGLLERLLKRAADGHHLADRLHAGPRLAVHVLELGQVPLGDLGHDVVERRLEARRGGLGHRVRQLGQRVAEGELGRRVGERVAGSLGRQRTGAAQTRVHLDHAVLATVRIQRVLNVALAHDAQVPDHAQRRGAQHVVVVVRERLRGGDHNRVACVDAERVKVLHVAADDGVVRLVAQHLVFALLPATQTLLHQHLRAQTERAGAQVTELLLVLREARAEPAERKGGPHNHGVPDRLGGAQRLVHRRHGLAAGDGDADLVECLDEQVAVLAHAQHVHLRAEHLDAEALKHAHLLELDTDVQRALSAKGEQHAVGALLLEHVRDVVGRDWEEVHLGCKRVAGLDRRDVRVDQHRLDAGLAQGLDRLGAAVVELARLPDAQAAGADEHHLLGVDPLRGGHVLAPALEPLGAVPLERLGATRRGGRRRGVRGRTPRCAEQRGAERTGSAARGHRQRMQ